jgi:adenylyltransferase/sulfurtransferase
VGAPKVEAARSALQGLNAEVEVVGLKTRVDALALDPLVAQADVVLDCSDNFPTRHALNRACVKHAKPLVSGAAIRFEAQLMVFDLRRADAPCYACLFPEDGDVEEVQCSVMGVFAPLTGVIGAMQAAEAIKFVTGAGESLSGRMVMFDAKSADWRTVRVKRDPACRVCGKR